MEVLGVRTGYYYADIQADEYRAYMLKHEIDLGLTYRRYEKVSMLLKELEDMLDMESVINRQYIEMKTAIVDNFLEKISIEAFLNAERTA